MLLKNWLKKATLPYNQSEQKNYEQVKSNIHYTLIILQAWRAECTCGMDFYCRCDPN
jgi:hypothetical protein